MKIISYNVNGIRAAIKKGFLEWLSTTNPDVVCIQETKAQPDQINPFVFEELGYKCYLHSAEKKGYSGVAILSKMEPIKIHVGCGIRDYDAEGRVIRADYENFSIISAYFPSGSSGDTRQAFKISFLNDFYDYIQELKDTIPNLIISGDYNICHKAIDIHNPQRNSNTSGFLPEEREWFSKFLNLGFIDTFRHFNSDPHHYSWWSYRARAREKNLGWRIDYNLSAKSLGSQLKSARILSSAEHSDHCPVLVELE